MATPAQSAVTTNGIGSGSQVWLSVGTSTQICVPPAVPSPATPLTSTVIEASTAASKSIQTLIASPLQASPTLGVIAVISGQRHSTAQSEDKVLVNVPIQGKASAND